MLDKLTILLSNKFNIDSEVIERVIRSEFKFVANTIEQGEFQSIRLHHLGVFGVKPNKLEKLNDRTKSIQNTSTS